MPVTPIGLDPRDLELLKAQRWNSDRIAAAYSTGAARSDSSITAESILADMANLAARYPMPPRKTLLMSEATWHDLRQRADVSAADRARQMIAGCPVRVLRDVQTQVRFPRSKKRRIRKKWRKDRRNWALAPALPRG